MNQPIAPLIWLGEKRGILYFEDMAAMRKAPTYSVKSGFYNQLQLYSVSGVTWLATLAYKPNMPFWAGILDGKRLIDIDLNFEQTGTTDLTHCKNILIKQYKKYPKDFTLRFDDGDQIMAGILEAPNLQDLFAFIQKTIRNKD